MTETTHKQPKTKQNNQFVWLLFGVHLLSWTCVTKDGGRGGKKTQKRLR